MWLFLINALATGLLSEAETQEVVREASRYLLEGDTTKAVEMWETASRSGSGLGVRESHFELANLKEGSEALDLYRKAAQEGHPGAQWSVAVASASPAYIDQTRNEDVAVLHEYFAALGEEPLAQMALGYRHLHGRGVPAKCESALAYYESAADAAMKQTEGVIRPNERLRLTEGYVWRIMQDDDFWGPAGVPEKDVDLLRYYRHAAELGDAKAQLTLGQLHYFGHSGVKQDLKKAAEYFEKAAVNKNAAVAWIGHLKLRGLGVDVDLDGARELLQNNDHEIAMNALGILKLMDGDVAGATSLFKKAWEKGVIEALYNLGLTHLGWDGTVAGEFIIDDFVKKRDTKKAADALRYLSTAVQNGHIPALHKVGKLYAKGIGASRSCEVAVNAFKTVAERGPWITELSHAFAMFKRGDAAGARLRYAKLAHAGYEVAQSNAAWLVESLAKQEESFEYERRALELYDRAAEQGNSQAQLKLGDMYYYGRGSEQDLEKAVSLYQQAHDLKNARATFNLAWCYQKGLGVKQIDLHLAKRHYGLAAEYSNDAVWPTRLALLSLYYDTVRNILRQAPVRESLRDDLMMFTLLVALFAILVKKHLRRRRRPMGPQEHEHEE